MSRLKCFIIFFNLKLIKLMDNLLFVTLFEQKNHRILFLYLSFAISFLSFGNLQLFVLYIHMGIRGFSGKKVDTLISIRESVGLIIEPDLGLEITLPKLNFWGFYIANAELY